MNGISVIVCCYNSIERIGTTLHYLKNQRAEDISWEVIIVDNNCTDGTVNEALKVWGNHPIKIKVIKEHLAGLIHARNTGIRSARYDFIIFCDDDNWLEETYLKNVYELFQINLQCGAIGGQSKIAIESGKTIPDWFKINENAYAVGKQASQSGDVTNRHYLWGAGLAIRKHLAERCFDAEFPFLLTGRYGNKVNAGDDSEICSRLVLMGYSLLYDERLQFQHFIPTQRLTENYLIQMKKGFEKSYGVLTLYSECIRALVLDKDFKINKLCNVVKEKPFSSGKLQRTLFWLYGLALNVNNDMRLIRGFYRKYNSYLG